LKISEISLFRGRWARPSRGTQELRWECFVFLQFKLRKRWTFLRSLSSHGLAVLSVLSLSNYFLYNRSSLSPLDFFSAQIPPRISALKIRPRYVEVPNPRRNHGTFSTKNVSTTAWPYLRSRFEKIPSGLQVALTHFLLSRSFP